jgi:hypothetical protein
MGAIGPLKRRLMDMGVLVGETISRGYSPFDCLEQSSRTCFFSSLTEIGFHYH